MAEITSQYLFILPMQELELDCYDISDGGHALKSSRLVLLLSRMLN